MLAKGDAAQEQTRWWQAPTFADDIKNRQARLLAGVLRAMGFAGAAGCAVSVLDARNSLVTTFVFYSILALSIAAMWALVRLGHVVGAAWGLSGFFWCLVAFVTLFFGGMKGENAGLFGVSVLVVGSVVSGRAATVLTLAASLWCGMVAYLEDHGRLPDPISPYTPINGWTAVSLTLLMTTVLLRQSLESLAQMHARAEAAAKARDDALRRSIQAQKMEVVGNLSAGIAHDFNNLLTVIGGAATFLRESIDMSNAELGEVMSDLDGATTRAGLMTRQLLAFGGNKEQGLVPVDLGALLLALNAMLPRLLGPRITVVTDAEPEAWVRATRAGLEQILLNLVVNARDAMPQGGTLRLAVRAFDSGVVLETSDTGAGIEETTLARIFEPFFTTKLTGTGLGLATTQELVAHFGGTITVDSTVGEGTTFRVRLVRVSGPIALPAAAPGRDTAALRSHGRLLLVEDDVLVRRTTGRLLEQAGFEVIGVSDGDEALALLSSGTNIACVISDISMARLDGDALARVIAARFPDLPMVLMSGYREPSAATLADARREFLPKPLDRDELLRAIARAVAPQS